MKYTSVVHEYFYMFCVYISAPSDFFPTLGVVKERESSSTYPTWGFSFFHSFPFLCPPFPYHPPLVVISFPYPEIVCKRQV